MCIFLFLCVSLYVLCSQAYKRLVKFSLECVQWVYSKEVLHTLSLSLLCLTLPLYLIIFALYKSPHINSFCDYSNSPQ